MCKAVILPNLSSKSRTLAWQCGCSKGNSHRILPGGRCWNAEAGARAKQGKRFFLSAAGQGRPCTTSSSLGMVNSWGWTRDLQRSHPAELPDVINQRLHSKIHQHIKSAGMCFTCLGPDIYLFLIVSLKKNLLQEQSFYYSKELGRALPS